MQKVLVTGASGFVGGHIARALHARGFAVRCLVRKTSRLEFLAPCAPELVYGDVTLPETLGPALAGVDGVVHCAGLTKAPSRQAYFRVNEEGCRNVFEACRARRDRLGKVVHIGSLAALGPAAAGQPVTEETQPRPVSDYGRSKLAGQRIAESFMADLPTCILIPPAVYGPRDVDFLVYFRIAARGLLLLPGRETRYLSLIYARDLAEAAADCLASARSAGRHYLVDDGCIQTWTSVAGTIERALGRRCRRIHLPLPAVRIAGLLGDLAGRLSGRAVLLNSQKIGEFLQISWTCSSRRIREELGFRPRFPLDEGIRETLAWYREQGWL